MLSPEDNTDDEQEDLPYDEDLRNMLQHNYYSQSLEDLTSLETDSRDVFTLTYSHVTSHSKETADCKVQQPQTKIHLASLVKENGMEFNTAEKECVSTSERNHYMTTSVISDVLLRHFPKEGLSGLSQLIDSETIPEVSFTESFDETILNTVKNSASAKLSSPRKEEENNLECCTFETKTVYESVDKNWNMVKNKQNAIDEIVILKCNKEDIKEGNPECVSQEKPDINEDLNYFSNPQKRYKEQNDLLESTPYLKYGNNSLSQQRHVHYQLPDFSKVAPRVKIPKGNGPNSNTIIKTSKSSFDLLGKSANVKDGVESIISSESAAIKNQEQEMKIREFDQQLELLTKQAEAQNQIDQLRFNTKMLPCSNSNRLNLGIKMQSSAESLEMSSPSPITVPVKPILGSSQSSLSEFQSGRMASPLPSAEPARQSPLNLPFAEKVSEKQTLSQMLRQRTEELRTKVEIFSKCVTQNEFPVQEQYQLLGLLKEQLDQLERNYLDTKEKLCGYLHQNYKYSTANTGDFDPDRKLEGEIFKLGMLFEDIKEKIDKSNNLHTPVSVEPPSSIIWESPSSCSEKPGTSNISISPNTTGSKGDFLMDDKYQKHRSNSYEAASQDINQQPTHHFHYDQLQLQKKNTSKKIEELLEKSQLLANTQSMHVGGQQTQRQLTTNQDGRTDQGNTDENLNYWEMRRSPPPAKPYSTSNQASNLASLPKSKEKDYPSDPRFLEEMENSAKDHDIIIHPRLKIQLSSKEVCSCSSSRNKTIQYKKTTRGKSECERFSIFLNGKADDLDLSGSDTEDSSFCDTLEDKRYEANLEHSIRSHGSWKVLPKEGHKDLNHRDWKTHFGANKETSKECEGCEIASLQKKSIALQRIYENKQPEQFIDRLCDRQNLQVPQTRYSRMYDTIILSPQYLGSKKSLAGRPLINSRGRPTEDINSETLGSSLDHVIQAANNLKKTTEHMMQAVSEDLAKAKIQTLSNLVASHSECLLCKPHYM